jgi:hypothetical protein
LISVDPIDWAGMSDASVVRLIADAPTFEQALCKACAR